MLRIMCHLFPLFSRVVAELPEQPPLKLGSKFTVHGATKISICASHVQKRVQGFGSAPNMNRDLQILRQVSEIFCFDKAS